MGFTRFTDLRPPAEIVELPLRELWRLILPGLLAVVLIELLAIVFFEVPFTGDVIEYLQHAKNLHDSQFFSFDGLNPSRMRQPLYPIFLSVFYYSLGESLLLVKIIQALLGLASFVGIMRLYNLCCGTRNLKLAGILIGLYVPLWMNCPGILTESLAIFLITFFFFTFLKALKKSTPGSYILPAILLGLAILTRPIAASLLVFVWIPFIYQSNSLKRRVIGTTVLVTVCALTLLPWSVRNYKSCGTWTPLSAEGEFMALKAADLANDVPPDSILSFEEITRAPKVEGNLLERSLRGIIENPFSFVGNALSRLARVWTYFPGSRIFFDFLPARIASHTIQILFLCAAVFGLMILSRQMRLFLLYPPLAFSFVLFFAGEAKSRFLLPIIPTLLIAAVFGVTVLLIEMKRRKNIARIED